MSNGKPQRVLVTGGSGFIGACLVRKLLAEGREVHLTVRPGARSWRLAGLQGRFTPHQADLLDFDSLRRAVARSRPDVVYHLATHGAHAHQNDRGSILSTNVVGTANLLDALACHDYRMLVHVGSSSEYGHKSGPMTEDDRLEPRSDYGVAKAATSLLAAMEAKRGRPIAVVRVFSAYGPWEDRRRLVPYVMGCCYRNVAPKVTAGWQPRDFIHVDDVVALLETAGGRPDLAGRVLHAGTGREHSVRDMVKTILSVCADGPIEADYDSQPTRADEPRRWVASIEQTVALTGWTPRYDLRAGVERTWDWYRGESPWVDRGRANVA